MLTPLTPPTLGGMTVLVLQRRKLKLRQVKKLTQVDAVWVDELWVGSSVLKSIQLLTIKLSYPG